MKDSKMSKGGSRKSAEQDAIDRRAARLRKQRGRGGVTEKPPEYLGGKSLVQVARENQQAAANRAERNEAYDRKQAIVEHAERLITEIEAKKAMVIPESTVGFGLIVVLLKKHFTGTDFRWSLTDGRFSIGLRRKA